LKYLVIQDANARALNGMINILCEPRKSQGENSTSKLRSLHNQTGNEKVKKNPQNKESVAGSPGASSTALWRRLGVLARGCRGIMSVISRGWRRPRGGCDILIQRRGRGLQCQRNSLCIWRTVSQWDKLTIWGDGSRLNCFSIGDRGMWRNCGADGGGSADRTLIKRPRESSRRTIAGAIVCITVASSPVGIYQPTSDPWRPLDQL